MRHVWVVACAACRVWFERRRGVRRRHCERAEAEDQRLLDERAARLAKRVADHVDRRLWDGVGRAWR